MRRLLFSGGQDWNPCVSRPAQCAGFRLAALLLLSCALLCAQAAARAAATAPPASAPVASPPVVSPPVISLSVASSANRGGSIHGMVKSGNMPIPGVAVTAASPQNRQRIVTWSDVDGSYWLQVPDDGEYFVRTQMAAFAPAFARVAIDANNRAAKADLEMVLLSRAPNTREQFAQQMAAQGGRGFQSLSVTQREGGADPTSGAADDPATPAGMPSLGASASTATESVAVSGATEGSTL